MPLPRFRLRSLLIAVALAAAFFAWVRFSLRFSHDLVYGVWLPLIALVITSYILVVVSRPDRMNPWSIVLVVIGFITLALMAFWYYALYQLGNVAV